MAMRWRMNEKPKGLAAAGAGPRGSTLWDGEKELARVSALRKNYVVIGWFWVSRTSGENVNTCSSPVESEKIAKQHALEHVKKYYTKG